MQPWAQAVLIACAVALTAALVTAMLALRRALRRTDAVLTIVEQELRPLIGQAHGLTDELRDLTRETRREVVRIGEVTEHVKNAAEGVGLAATGTVVTGSVTILVLDYILTSMLLKIVD